MVVSIKAISDVDSTVKYFYLIEQHNESARGWHQNALTKELGLTEITKENLKAVLEGRIRGVQLGRVTKDGIQHHAGQELVFSAPKSVSIMALVAKDERLLKAHET